MLRYLTAGESHGKALVAILEGLPSGVAVDEAFIADELKRRQGGYGRGGRMQIEQDRAEILSGVRKGQTMGSPVALLIINKDFKIDVLPEVKHPRPGHADLSGALKYDHRDIRNVLERASARETAARVAVGAVCKQLLEPFGVSVFSHVIAIGDANANVDKIDLRTAGKQAESSPVRCADPKAAAAMMKAIDAKKKAGDTLGGIFEVVALGAPVGLGSYVQQDRRLDARVAQAVMAIHAVKAVEIGSGVSGAQLPGSAVHDEIFYSKAKGFHRTSNRSGGFEGGMTTGEPVIVRGYLKPISTLMKPLRSVNIDTKAVVKASVERSDVCTVPAAGVIGEAAVAFVLAQALLEKFGGDSLGETLRNYKSYLKQVAAF